MPEPVPRFFRIIDIFFKGCIWFTLAVLLVMTPFCVYSYLTAGIHTTDDPAACPFGRLPEGASDIVYEQPGPLGPASRCSFAIDAAGFRRWVAAWQELNPGIRLVEPPAGNAILRSDRLAPLLDRPESELAGIGVDDVSYFRHREGDLGTHLIFVAPLGRAVFYSHYR